jgi:hypothetical protein
MNAMFMMFAVFLFIGGNIFSLMMEGKQAFASSKLASSITATSLFIPLDAGFGGASGFPSSETRIFIGDEEIQYDSIQTTNDANCTGETDPCLVLSADDRGINGTKAVAHAEGSRVYSESAGLINQIVSFKVGNTDSLIEKVSVPFQASWAMVKFFAKLVMWDYSFLEGDGVWLKLFLLYPISGAVILGLIGLLRGPAERLLPI